MSWTLTHSDHMGELHVVKVKYSSGRRKTPIKYINQSISKLMYIILLHTLLELVFFPAVFGKL